MRNALIALAAAGALASGAAVAGTSVLERHADFASATIVPVQYGVRSEERAATIYEREARINARIQRGLRDGRITNREARHLYRELADVRAKERAFRSDGRLGGRETAELNHDLDRLAEHVREQLRDEDRRY